MIVTKCDDMIVTKCDDISPKEITKALHLGDNPQYQKLQNDVQHHKTEVAKWKEQEKSIGNASRGKQIRSPSRALLRIWRHEQDCRRLQSPAYRPEAAA